MTIDEALRARLNPLIAERVYLGVAPQGAIMPYLTYRTESAERPSHMLGTSGLAYIVYELTLWGLATAPLAALAEEIRLAMDGWRGDVGGVHIRLVILQDVKTDVADDEAGGQEMIAVRILNYAIWYVRQETTFPNT